MTLAYLTPGELQTRLDDLHGEVDEGIDSLDRRLRQVETDVGALRKPLRRYRRAEVQVLSLKPGDVLVMRTPVPLASSEREAIVKEWKTLIQRKEPRADFVLLCGADVSLSVVRKDDG